MKMKKLLAGALAFSAMVSHQTAWAQDNAAQCLASEEAEALLTVLLPGAVTSVTGLCKSYLPANATLSQSAKYIDNVLRPAAREAFPIAYGAFSIISGRQLPEGFGYNEIAPIMDLAIGQEITKGLKPENCGSLNTIYTSIQTMQPQQTSALLVALVQIAAADDKTISKDFPICPATLSE